MGKRIVMKNPIKKAADIIGMYKNWFRLGLYRFDIIPGPMTVELRDGSKFMVRDRREQESEVYVVNESFLYGIHNGMLPYMAKAKVGLDIGAHIGTFSVFAARRSPATIYAIEPEPENFALLEQNIRLNGLEKRIITTQAAVLSKSGERPFYTFQNHALSSFYTDHAAKYTSEYGSTVTGTRTVRTTNLEDFFAEHRIEFCDFMKVDAEEAERDIFYNLPQRMYDRIGVIGMEISGMDDAGDRKLVNHITGMGFSMSRPFGEYFFVSNRLVKPAAVRES